jgi:hypothetical protein
MKESMLVMKCSGRTMTYFGSSNLVDYFFVELSNGLWPYRDGIGLLADIHRGDALCAFRNA